MLFPFRYSHGNKVKGKYDISAFTKKLFPGAEDITISKTLNVSNHFKYFRFLIFKINLNI